MKFSVIPQDADRPVLSGLAERLGIDRATITFKDRDGNSSSMALAEASHQHALDVLFGKLAERQLLNSLTAIGHRVAHGGSDFKRSVRVTDEVIEKIRALSALAPLHNPANLIGIEAARALLPALPQIAVFDTAFHQTLSPAAYTYAIPLEYQHDYQVRRYGFHGTSHRYVSAQAHALLGLSPDDSGLVIAHLGNGASICAVRNGVSVDTSMGMTPLEGLVMGTRCGDVDFGAMAWIARQTGQSFEDLERVVNKESGLLGISGISSDLRALEKARHDGNERARLAIKTFVHRIARHIAGHAASLHRLDGVVFTGGIGENSVLIRALVVEHLKVFGIILDESKNALPGSAGERVISTESSRAACAVIPTNEEKMIALDALRLGKVTPAAAYA